MLRALPNGWFSYDFTVFDGGGTPVARVDLAHWRETAKLEVGGTCYKARREGWASKEFVLEKEGGWVVCVAEKPSAWRERFVFGHSGNRYELKKESVWSSAFVLSRDGMGPVGSIRQKGCFNREWMVDVPEELPVEVKVFVVWLAVVLLKRRGSAAAATASTSGAGG